MSHITAKTNINIIIGDPVEHSLSPQIHNAGYEALGIDNKFVFVAAHVKPENLEDFVKGAKASNINGICATIPHKVAIMPFLDEIHSDARTIGAVNTVVNTHGKLIGFNTDWIGVAEPLKAVTPLKGKKAAIIGAGGAARAMIFALQQNGAEITIFNRTFERAQTLAKEFQCIARPLTHIEEVADMNIILNASSVGLSSHDSLIPKEFLNKNHIVFDAVYIPFETQLLQDALKAGAQIIHGTEMLLYQGVEQFKLFTNETAPIDKMRRALMKTIKK